MKTQSPLCFLESGMVLCYTVHKSPAVKVSARMDFQAGKGTAGAERRRRECCRAFCGWLF